MQRKIPLWLFSLIVCVFYCATITVIEFSDQPVNDIFSFAKTAMLYLLVSIASWGVFSLLSVSRRVFALLFPPLMAFSGAMGYLGLTIGSRVSETSIEIALGNDAEMWFSVITPGLAAAILIGLAIGIFFARMRWRNVVSTSRQRWVMTIAGVIITIGSMTASPKIIWTVGNRLPYSLYYCFNLYLTNKKEAAAVRTTYEHTPALAADNAPDVIFVIGESLRADHLPMNGYHRNTLPKISEDSLLVNFPDIYTDHTNTNIAVPHLLTRYSAQKPNHAFSDQSFITLFKNAGYKTAWFANQNLTKYYSYFANEADSLIYCNDGKSIFHYERTLDTDMIPPFRQWINEPDSAPRLAILHAIGSHWWYPTHYTEADETFTPVIKHKEIAGLSNEAIVNSYDNTILATDRFLAELRATVNQRNAIIIYMSDHGELLGEDGCYLHDGNQEPLHRPAAFVLSTATYAANFPQVVDSLRMSASTPMSATLTFHTLLSLGRISTPALNPDSTFLSGRPLR